MTGPCHVVAFVLVPFTFLGLVVCTWRQRTILGPENVDIHWAFALLLAGAFAVLLITPFAVEDEPGTRNQMQWHYCPVRYGMCFLSLTVLALSLVLQGICSRHAALVWFPLCFFLATGVFQSIFPDPRLPLEWVEVIIIAGNLLFLAGNLALLATLWPRLGRAAFLVGILAVLVGGEWGIPRLADRWHRGFAAFYDRTLSPGTYSSLAANAPPGAICVLDHRGYPFFGSRRQFRVCQPMYVPSSSWLMRYFQDRNVRLVAIRRDRRAQGWHLFEHFDECLRDNPDHFRRIKGDGTLVLFEIVPASPPQ